MSNEATVLKFKDGDGDGPEEGWEVESFTITVVTNGYILHVIYQDGDELIEVYQDISDVFKRIQSML